MSSQVIALSQDHARFELKTSAGPIAATFTNLGTPTSFPAKQLVIVSTMDKDLIFTFDNSGVDELLIAAGNTSPQTMIINLQASCSCLTSLAQIKARAVSGPTTSGSVSVTLIG